MAKTIVDLYRALLGDDFKKVKIKVGQDPGPGILYPRWEAKDYYSKKLNKWLTSPPDVKLVEGENGPEVLEGGGTSLHDVAHWFNCKEFWIPEGTEYSDEQILIKKDDKEKTSPYNANVRGYHYQLEPRLRMTVEAFKGALDNMSRAAVVRQIELVNS